VTVQLVGQKKVEQEKRQFLVVLFEDLIIFFKVKVNQSYGISLFKTKSNSTSSKDLKASSTHLVIDELAQKCKYVFDDEHEVNVKYYSHSYFDNGKCVVGGIPTNEIKTLDISCTGGNSLVQYTFEFSDVHGGANNKLQTWYAQLVHCIDEANKN
jgi:hypothetical protein